MITKGIGLREHSGQETVRYAKYPAKSLIKALRLIDALSESAQGQSIANLSRDLKVGKSTVHRMLSTLRDYGVVLVDPLTSNYTLGPKVLQWNETITLQNTLLCLGIAALRKLTSLCNETTNLAVPRGIEILYILKQECAEPLRMNVKIGTQLPSHCTALGKAVLATLSLSEFHELYSAAGRLKASTAHSITDIARLWKHLQTIRDEGVAYDFEEMYEGLVCMAAPVRDHTSRAIAALSISMPRDRVAGERLVNFRKYLLDAAGELSSSLGYRPPASGAVPEVPVPLDHPVEP